MNMTADDVYSLINLTSSLLPKIITIIIILLISTLALILLRKLVAYIWFIRTKRIYLAITPPSMEAKTPEATRKLFMVMHGLGRPVTLVERLLDRTSVYTFEFVSSKSEGIRYIVGVPESELETVKHDVAAYLPNAKIKRLDTYPTSRADYSKDRIVEFRQSGHYAFPLQPQDSSDAHDPVAYLTGQFAQLTDDEQITFQIVAYPARIVGAESIGRKVLSNGHVLSELSRKRGRSTLSKVGGIIASALFSMLDGFFSIFQSSYPSSYGAQERQHKQQVASGRKPARVISSFEQQLIESINDKVSQPLFRADIRAVLRLSGAKSTKSRIKALQSSLSVFDVPKYQSLRRSYNFPAFIVARYRLMLFQHRLPAFFGSNSSVLSSSELSDLYHFPLPNTQTENLVKSFSRTLPASVTLKNNEDSGLVIGVNKHNEANVKISLSPFSRSRHLYIVGSTGSGKTTLMLNAIVQDIVNGEGVAAIDPHGDMAEEILSYIPEERKNDVIYFNPDDLGFPIGINLLDLPTGLSEDDILRHKEVIAEATVSIFRKIFSEEDKGGHRIEYLIRNTVHTALTLENPTLFTIFDLLNDPKFRKAAVAKLTNKHLKNFWMHEFAKAGDFQQVKMSAGVTNKVGRFLFSASAERIIGQPKSTIDFDDIIDSGKILICNLSKGLLGEDTSELFGITILAQLQMAIMRRARIKAKDRKPFYLYVDEFQNFATPSFKQLLSEGRKYKVSVTIAHQSVAQHEDQQMLSNILDNVGSTVVFRTGSPESELKLLPLFAPYIQLGEISNLPAYNFYAKIHALTPQEPVSGETIVLPEPAIDGMSERVVEASRRNYANPYTPNRDSRQSESTDLDENDFDEDDDSNAIAEAFAE